MEENPARSFSRANDSGGDEEKNLQLSQCQVTLQAGVRRTTYRDANANILSAVCLGRTPHR